MNWLRPLLILPLITLLASTSLAQDAPSPQELCDLVDAGEFSRMQFDAADNVLEPAVDYRAILCTSAGAIYVDLYERLTPITVNSFVFLAQQGYYDSTTFHRVIPNFMAQGGDPTGTGSGGPGYRFQDEPIGFLTFNRPGLLAMANAGPGTNGSQFFITTAPTPHLNYKHTIFGDVLIGQDVVDAIRERDPAAASEPGEALRNALIITDPADVDDSAIEPLPRATQDQVASAFQAFAEGLPPTYPTNAERSGLFNSGHIAESLALELRDPYTDFAERYDHQYRYRVEIENVNCDAAIYFTTLGYQVDVFGSAAQAADALADDLTRRLLENQGYARDAATAATYSRDLPTCAEEDGRQTLSLYAYGRFLVSIDVLIADQVLAQAGVTGGFVLADLSRQIESGFADIYLPEIRA